MKEWEEQEREGIPKGDRMHERDIEEEGNDREGKGWGIGIKTFFLISWNEKYFQVLLFRFI
jgi:hypothetical protein